MHASSKVSILHSETNAQGEAGGSWLSQVTIRSSQTWLFQTCLFAIFALKLSFAIFALFVDLCSFVDLCLHSFGSFALIFCVSASEFQIPLLPKMAYQI